MIIDNLQCAPMSVWRYPGERGVFLVRSQERKKHNVFYRIELEPADGVPWPECDCENSLFVVQPTISRLMRGTHPKDADHVQTTCKHVDRLNGALELCRYVAQSIGYEPEQAALVIPELNLNL